MHYKTKGTCSTYIDLEIENGLITECRFTGGCMGNTGGLSKMVVGRDAREVMNLLKGTPCKGTTSCPDQLSRAIEQYLEQNKAQ